MINASNEGICVEFLRKNYTTVQLALPTFKLPARTKNLLRLTRYILLLTISVYDH